MGSAESQNCAVVPDVLCEHERSRLFSLAVLLRTELQLFNAGSKSAFFPAVEVTTGRDRTGFSEVLACVRSKSPRFYFECVTCPKSAE